MIMGSVIIGSVIIGSVIMGSVIMGSVIMRSMIIGSVIMGLFSAVKIRRQLSSVRRACVCQYPLHVSTSVDNMLRHLWTTCCDICGQHIATSIIVRDLGAVIDTGLSTASEVANACRSVCYRHFRIARTRESCH